MLVLEDGVVSWGPDPLSTVEQADAYATARGWSDWAALTPEQKAVAILDASTYVKASFGPPAYPLSTTAEGLIQSAAIEAARLSLTGPLLGGDVAGQRARKAVRAGSVSVEYEASSTTSLRSSRLALVLALLRSGGVIIGSAVNFALRKA